MSWIKIQNGLVTNKKTARLAREMKWDKLRTVGFLVSFWVWAIENCEDGLLRDITDTEIAFGVGVENMDGILSALKASGLVDDNPLRIHSWVEHQHDFLWGKYKDKSEKRQELLQIYSGVTPEPLSCKTERKKEREINKGEVAKPPTIQEVRAWAESEKIPTDTDKFFYFYESKGWVGVVDWKAALKYWKSTDFKDKQATAPIKSIPTWKNTAKEDADRRNAWHEKHTAGGKCHFCGAEIKFPHVCNCQGYSVAFLGFCSKEGIC